MRREVVDQHIRAIHELLGDGAIIRAGEVEHDAALAAVQPREVRRLAMQHAVVSPRDVAPVGALDFHDVRAEIGQLPGAERPRDRLLERDHAQAAQWHRVARRAPHAYRGTAPRRALPLARRH